MINTVYYTGRSDSDLKHLTAGHGGATIHAARQGVNQVDNNVLLNTCGRGGQHAGSQRFRVGAAGAVTLSPTRRQMPGATDPSHRLRALRAGVGARSLRPGT